MGRTRWRVHSQYIDGAHLARAPSASTSIWLGYACPIAGRPAADSFTFPPLLACVASTVLCICWQLGYHLATGCHAYLLNPISVLRAAAKVSFSLRTLVRFVNSAREYGSPFNVDKVPDETRNQPLKHHILLTLLQECLPQACTSPAFRILSCNSPSAEFSSSRDTHPISGAPGVPWHCFYIPLSPSWHPLRLQGSFLRWCSSAGFQPRSWCIRWNAFSQIPEYPSFQCTWR
jgi:hypothetical protein